MFLCLNLNLSAQNVQLKKSEKSLIEVGSFLNFNKFKVNQSAGFYGGYWYRFPVDETRTRLELGANFGYSKSFYEFDYGKDGILYPIRSEEFMWNFGARMIKEYPLKNNTIEWVSELSLHNLILMMEIFRKMSQRELQKMKIQSTSIQILPVFLL